MSSDSLNSENPGVAPETETELVTYERLAFALASDFESLYYVNTEDDSYVEYAKSYCGNNLRRVSSGSNFFADSVKDCNRLVYKDDRDKFLSAFKKENVLTVINGGGAFTLEYRLVIEGKPRHCSLKTIRVGDTKYIVIGVRNIDERFRRERRADEERQTYSQIADALASRYEVIYYIDLETDGYIQYDSSEQYAQLGVRTRGDDFFTTAQQDIKKYIYSEDVERVLDSLKRENFVNRLSLTGSYTLTYRQLLGGRPQYVTMNAVRPKGDESHIVIGVMNVDAVVRRELEFKERLGDAMEQASRDGLTGVKNKHAYLRAEEELDNSIADGSCGEFAIIVSDMNGLKDINDTFGHNVGDDYIKSACHLICDIFKHSPVFRVGGDEFAVILRGDDHQARDTLMSRLEEKISENMEQGLVTVSCGMSEYKRGSDKTARQVFDRADTAMYENKKRFKSRGI